MNYGTRKFIWGYYNLNNVLVCCVGVVYYCWLGAFKVAQKMTTATTLRKIKFMSMIQKWANFHYTWGSLKVFLVVHEMDFSTSTDDFKNDLIFKAFPLRYHKLTPWACNHIQTVWNFLLSILMKLTSFFKTSTHKKSL